MPTTRLTQSGAIELPADLRQRLGLLEGDEVILEERGGGIFLRPAVEQEMWTQEEIAGYLLNNSVTKEDYDRACEEVRKMGFDPAAVPYTDPDMREKLSTQAEFLADFAAFEQRAKDRKLSPA
jgi:AbrB family looped-hinge helix DNA binding protein